MASYLEGYGETQAKRARTLRWLIFLPLATIILATILYFTFRDYREHRLGVEFVDLLKKQDYKSAYRLWGCTDEKPCPQYAFDKFLEDWGPEGAYKNAAQAEVAESRGCKGGVIEVVRAPGQEDVHLWIDRRTKEIGFAPWKLKGIPPGIRPRLASWMWSITQNCDPLIAP